MQKINNKMRNSSKDSGALVKAPRSGSISSTGTSHTDDFSVSSHSEVSASAATPRIPLTANQRMFQEWFDLINAHDVELMEDMLDPDCEHTCEQGVMQNHEYLAEMGNLFKSFPDFSFRYFGKIEEISLPNEEGRFSLRCKQVVSKGTHTGEDYGYGPYPSVPPKGKAVSTDAEIVTLTIDRATRRIVKIKVVPTGENSGMAALYTQIGGFPLI